MNHKHVGFILLGAAGLLYYANSQVNNPNSGVTLVTPFWGQLASLDNQPASISPMLPTLDILVAVAGAYLAFFHKG